MTITQNITADHENISDPTERGQESLHPLLTKKIKIKKKFDYVSKSYNYV